MIIEGSPNFHQSSYRVRQRLADAPADATCLTSTRPPAHKQTQLPHRETFSELSTLRTVKLVPSLPGMWVPVAFNTPLPPSPPTTTPLLTHLTPRTILYPHNAIRIAGNCADCRDGTHPRCHVACLKRGRRRRQRSESHQHPR